MSIDQRRDLIRRLSLASENGMAARRGSVGPREVQIVVTVVSAVIESDGAAGASLSAIEALAVAGVPTT